MAQNLAQKILSNHLLSGQLIPGNEIAIKIDQTLLQDATGTMAMLQFEAQKVDRVKVNLAAQYVDHNLLQTDYKNADDHRYLQTACARYGIHFSRPGNGISHQVHMERFGVPGQTLLGADSHTPSASGISMLAFGAGGLDVSLAMAGKPYYLPCPIILGVKLVGKLPDWVSARDVIFEMLKRHGVKGCLGKIIEYYGPGVENLSAGDRKNIGNMGAELGATSSIFPSDKQTLAYLQAENRQQCFQDLKADPKASYDEHDEINLSQLEPLIACPSSPDNVVAVKDVAGTKVDQVIIGSSANGSFRDLMIVAEIVKDQTLAPDVSFHINPSSREVLENVSVQGGVTTLIKAGARIHQSGCLGCIGMGQAPGTGQVSLRTFPRNFPGRSGTLDDRVYLCSSETASAAVIKGVICDPRELSPSISYPNVCDPKKFVIDLNSIIFPDKFSSKTKVIRGPNITPLPHFSKLEDSFSAHVVFRVGDNITTDDIMPAGNEILPLRSNIKAISQYVFHRLAPNFASKFSSIAGGVVIGGKNYGQGSSREHAALAPRYLGVRAKIALSFARIHKANLCNFGILPLTFSNPKDYKTLKEGTEICFPDIKKHIKNHASEIPIIVNGQQLLTILDVSDRQREMIIAGGAINLP